DAMQRMGDLEAELAAFERQALRSVTAEQKRQILQLGRDFPRLWKARTTSACDRKRMLRLLIRDITVAKGPEPKLLRLRVCWQGGANETIEVRQRPKRQDAIRYPDTFVAKIRDMAKHLPRCTDHRSPQQRGSDELHRQAIHADYDTLDPPQASYPQSLAPGRNPHGWPGLSEI